MNKFRLWDIQRKVMVYSDNNNYGVEIYLDGSFSVEFYRDGHWWCEDSDRYILMRSTELFDKIRKEIYERDVIKTYIIDTEYIGKIQYADKWSSFYFATKNDYNCGIAFKDVFEWYYEDEEIKAEVIGNIDENPDLLK